ncbi:hypothetical protein [Pseudanabaena sp. PCC 6802]|uniref:hypothetical protein n=1 Tax=Pseudanabaena sp. PCC 6802 TaxID=118173 RepID=UPI0003470834|nr:hypothetical protein [Pseudanabaena sp. PCC 6802]
MSEPGIAELLRQGNAIVLAALINRLLLPYAMTATLEKCDRRLNLSISSSQRLPELDFSMPDRQGLVALVQRLLLRLNVQAIDRVNLSWQLSNVVQDLALPDRKFDCSEYAWNAEFNLANPETTAKTDDERSIEPAPENSRLAKCDRDLPAPTDNFGNQLVQYAIATLIMAGLFLGIHFAINNNKPAKNSPNSALMRGIIA